MSTTSECLQWQPPSKFSASNTTSSMSSPTSVPKSSSANKERKLKLRASCDMCAASKVKCSKEHPICARCLANGSPCIYGVSRKHGKPGRTRKRNPDGTPFIKSSKQRPSPDGSEFGKFRIHPEPLGLPLPDIDAASNWSSAWSSTPSLPGTPEFDFDMAPEPFYMDSSDLAFMDDIFLPTTQLEPEPMQTLEPELAFKDPFAKRPSVQLNLPDMQALKDFIGGDTVNPMDYTFQDATYMGAFQIQPIQSVPQSPKSKPLDGYNSMRVNIPMPTSHCCWTLAYSTLESLRIISSEDAPGCLSLELKSLDSVLTTTKLAVQSVMQLLSCSCSSDPHLAMLYSSITSKILTWYQIAAGVNVDCASNSSYSSSPSSSVFSSPLSTPSSENELMFGVQMQPLRFGAYEFDELEQEKLRRQVVSRELKNCGQLIEAIANWSGDGQAQAEFLYDVLGAWLKSELYKIAREVDGVGVF